MKSRKGVELILRARRRPPAGRAGRAHRALSRGLYDGPTPRDRAAADRGELLGVVATDALELGIDIGELDAAVCVTFPGTVASLRQMWGRAGRRGRGLAVYIAGEDALDQFFCRHPDEFLGRARSRRRSSIPTAGDLRRASAVRRARGSADRRGRGDPRARVAQHAQALTEAGFLRERATGFVPQARRRLPRGAGRAALGVGRQLRADRRQLGGGAGHDRGRPRLLHGPRGRDLPAPRPLLPRAGAGSGRAAVVLEPFDGDYFTQAKREIMVYIERLGERRLTRG